MVIVVFVFFLFFLFFVCVCFWRCGRVLRFVVRVVCCGCGLFVLVFVCACGESLSRIGVDCLCSMLSLLVVCCLVLGVW